MGINEAYGIWIESQKKEPNIKTAFTAGYELGQNAGVIDHELPEQQELGDVNDDGDEAGDSDESEGGETSDEDEPEAQAEAQAEETTAVAQPKKKSRKRKNR